MIVIFFEIMSKNDTEFLEILPVGLVQLINIRNNTFEKYFQLAYFQTITSYLCRVFRIIVIA